ncbi:MAG: hypothetical protein V2A54_16545 [Bacteroidota bacterium]
MNTIEIDLHIESLLDHFSGLDNAAMLEYQLDVFQKALYKHRNQKGLRIVFIHGEGTGKLKSKMKSVLKNSFSQHTFFDASTINSIKYRIGTAIVVTIK